MMSAWMDTSPVERHVGMVVFSIIIMIVVLFFRRGIMGDREISLAGLAKRLTRRSVKGGKEA